MADNKKTSDVAVMLKEAAILFAITLLSGLILGFFHELTGEPIRIQQEKAVQEACKAVFPEEGETACFEPISDIPEGLPAKELAGKGITIGSVFQALDGTGKPLGYVIESVSSEGYGGEIVLYVGISTDMSVSGVSILEISETPGLGMEASKVLIPQFTGRQVKEFTYTKTGSRQEDEIDAISGATVTTKAVVNGVNGALEAAKSLMEGGSANE